MSPVKSNDELARILLTFPIGTPVVGYWEGVLRGINDVRLVKGQIQIDVDTPPSLYEEDK